MDILFDEQKPEGKVIEVGLHIPLTVQQLLLSIESSSFKVKNRKS